MGDTLCLCFVKFSFPAKLSGKLVRGWRTQGCDSLSRVCATSRAIATVPLFAFVLGRFFISRLNSYVTPYSFRLYTFASHLHLGTPTIPRAITLRLRSRTPRCARCIHLRNVPALSSRLFSSPHLGSIFFIRQFENPFGIAKERETRPATHRSHGMNSREDKSTAFVENDTRSRFSSTSLRRFSEMENEFAPYNIAEKTEGAQWPSKFTQSVEFSRVHRIWPCSPVVRYLLSERAENQ
jgi:hypothetical protein